MDLGSALMSAEMALEFLPEEQRDKGVSVRSTTRGGALAAAVRLRLVILSMSWLRHEVRWARNWVLVSSPSLVVAMNKDNRQRNNRQKKSD